VPDNLTDTAENRTLNWLTGNSTTAPVLPLMCRLMTANGSDSAAGTEVTNSGGSTYAPQEVAFGTASGGATENTGALVFEGMPAVTVVGVEIWDDAGTPVRWWHGPLAASKTLNAGDTFTIAAGDLDLSLG
jgi:hypothetical protein